MESIFLFFTFLMLFSHILSLLSLYLPRNLAQRTEPHILSLLSLCLSSPYPLSLSLGIDGTVADEIPTARSAFRLAPQWPVNMNLQQQQEQGAKQEGRRSTAARK